MNKKFFMPSVLALFLTVLFIRNSELTSLFVKRGLECCFLTIIPSLFPLMVLSEILCGCGALEFIGKLVGKRLKSFFKLSEKSLAAVFLGLIFGFPIGTRALCHLYDKNEISGDELESCVGFCGIPSFGFTVNVIGASLFSNRQFGIFLFAVSICSALVSGIIFSNKRANEYKFVSPAPKKEKNTAEIITGAISSSTGAIITLCAYVIFFSCIVGCISDVIFLKGSGALVGAFFELLSGAVASADLGGTIGVALCGFTVGWSGFSVHCQAMALISDRVKNFGKYLTQKLFQGLLCSLCAILYALITGFKPQHAGIEVFSPIFTPEYTAIIFIIFFLCVFGCKNNFLRQKKGLSH